MIESCVVFSSYSADNKDEIAKKIKDMSLMDKNKLIPAPPIELVKFLKQNNALTSYVDNFLELNGMYVSIPIPRQLNYRLMLLMKNRENIGQYLYHSFCWQDTKEGYVYWKDMFIKAVNYKYTK